MPRGFHVLRHYIVAVNGRRTATGMSILSVFAELSLELPNICTTRTHLVLFWCTGYEKTL